MTKDPIVVMKFGGSVLKDADGFRRAATIIKAERRKKIVVVSAMAGVTDELYKLAEMATKSQQNNARQEFREEAMKKYREILSKHLAILRELDIKPRPDQFDEICIYMEKVIDMIGFMKEPNQILTDALVSQGEKFSAIILSALIAEHVMFTYVPATELINVIDAIGGRSIYLLWDQARFSERLNSENNVLVTEGFVASTWKNQTITLGRNGSDYSAALIGSSLPDVEEVQFWKDVQGVMTVDPKLTMLATPLSSISYNEIIEATRLGAKILHPESIAPLFGINNPLFNDNERKIMIKNINEPHADGTEIVKKSTNKTAHGVTMMTVEQDLGIFSIHDSEKSVEHLAPKVYLTLRQANIEFATVSQGFSDQNATIITRKKDFEKTCEVINQITGNKLTLVRPVAQIAVIGSNMRGKPGIAGKFLSALGKAGVNILTIQQGSSECSMAATINDKDIGRAIIAVHDAFELEKK